MKIEVLENNKIKVTLTFEDLIFYNLKPDKITPDYPGLQKFLFNIMENVRRETGMNPYKGAVAVEAVSSREGMVLYISGFKKSNQSKHTITMDGVTKTLKASCKKEVAISGGYIFENFEDLCNAINRIDNESHRQSCLYKYNDKWYYIFNGDDGKNIHYVLSEYCSEFGSIVYGEDFLNEHGELVAEKDTLVSMAEGIKKLYDRR